MSGPETSKGPGRTKLAAYRALTEQRSYDAACAEATMDQGLGPVVVALASGLVPCVVDQTGGMTMVATVRKADDDWLGITIDPAATGDQLLVCWYDGVDSEGEVMIEDATVLDVVSIARRYLSDAHRRRPLIRRMT